MQQNTNGTLNGFTVEGRLQGGGIEEVCCNRLDGTWRKLKFAEAIGGVPADTSYPDGILKNLGLMNYEGAQAMRWWFHADARNGAAMFALETRIVPHKVKYSMECEPDGEPKDHVGTWKDSKK